MRYIKNRYLLCLFIVTCLLSCSPRVIKIGVAVPLSGSGTSRGQEILNAVLLAVEEVNLKGGIKGRKLKLVVQDDKDVPEQGVAAADALLKAGVLGVIGHYSSDVTLAALPRYVGAKTSLISPSVALSKVSEEGRYFFRTLPNNTVQAKVAAEFIHLSDFQRVSIIDNGSIYGKDLALELQAALKKYPAIQVGEFSEEPGAEFVRKVINTVPELVFYAGGYRDSALFLQRMHEAGSLAEFMGGNALYDKEFIRLAGLVHIDKVWLVGNQKSPENAFYTSYQQRFGPPGFLAEYAYDAAHLLFMAVEKSARLQPGMVSEVLQNSTHFKGVSGEIALSQHLPSNRVPGQSILSITEAGEFDGYIQKDPLSSSAGQVVGAWANAGLTALKRSSK